MLKSAFSLAAACLFAASVFGAQVPRPAEDFTFKLPDGREKHLSDYKGKVIALVFMSPTCPHCQHLTEAIHPMTIKYAGKDVQILEIAFDTMASYIPEFNQKYNPPFPVGYAPRDKIESFMQHSVMQMFMVPQMVLIDKRFVIQKQFPAGDPAIVGAPESLYASIDALLSEPGKKNASSAGVHRIAKK